MDHQNSAPVPAPAPTHHSSSQLIPMLALIVAAFAMLISVFAVSNLNILINALAKYTRKPVESDTRRTVEMVVGDSVELKCSSWNLLIQRKGRDSLTAWCSALPNEKNPDEAPVSGTPSATPVLPPGGQEVVPSVAVPTGISNLPPQF